MVRADDGCTNPNTCNDVITLNPSLPVPQVTDLDGDFCIGGNNLTINATVDCGHVIEYSFDGGATWGTSNTASGLSSPVSIEVRTQDTPLLDRECDNTTATFTADNCPLPVAFNNFSGEINGEINVLSWETSIEINAQEFVIERSNNGIDKFFSIGKEIAKQANTGAFYTMNDNEPLQQSYYRLKAIGFNGEVIYSNVVLLSRNDIQLEITNLYPNPTNSSIKVEYMSRISKNVTFTITDVVGRILFTNTTNAQSGNNSMELDMSNYSEGVYMISIDNGVNSIVKKVTKLD